MLSVCVQKMDYVMYLTVFDRLFDVPKERKNASYKASVYVVFFLFCHSPVYCHSVICCLSELIIVWCFDIVDLAARRAY